MVALHLFLSGAKSSKFPSGILVAERLYFSFSCVEAKAGQYCFPIF